LLSTICFADSDVVEQDLRTQLLNEVKAAMKVFYPEHSLVVLTNVKSLITEAGHEYVFDFTGAHTFPTTDASAT
jgi:hypothetical protein